MHIEFWGVVGLKVNGELFETDTSRPEHPVSYFARIGVTLENSTIVFSRDGTSDNWNTKP